MRVGVASHHDTNDDYDDDDDDTKKRSYLGRDDPSSVNYIPKYTELKKLNPLYTDDEKRLYYLITPTSFPIFYETLKRMGDINSSTAALAVLLPISQTRQQNQQPIATTHYIDFPEIQKEHITIKTLKDNTYYTFKVTQTVFVSRRATGLLFIKE